MNGFSEKLDLRTKNARLYTEFLMRKKKNHVYPELFKNHAFLKYPLIVNRREKFLELAEKAKIPIGDWFISPLHPVEQDFSPWYLKPESYPVARQAASKVVNLPTDTKNIQAVLKFLESNIDLIENNDWLELK